MLHFMQFLVAAVLVSGAAQAQPSNAPAEVLTHIPAGAMTLTTWHGQSVYDPSGSKIGEISDVLIDPQGSVTAIILGVGNFLGVPDNDIAVSFASIRHGMRDGKPYLTMIATKDFLKTAPTFKFNKTLRTWTR